MPIREYSAVEAAQSCRYCKEAFEEVESIDAPARETCPRCGARVERRLSAPRIGGSQTGLQDRAKNAGFTTYKKLGQGEYEKQ